MSCARPAKIDEDRCVRNGVALATVSIPGGHLIGRTHRGEARCPRRSSGFERAAQAPAPSPEEGYMVMYELADALESVGEVARAWQFALSSRHAPEFRDVASRVDRLNKVQTGVRS